MNLSQISKWLRKTPQPATILIDDSKRIDVGTRGGRWTEVARSIVALNASKLTALDGQGSVLRAIEIDDGSGDDETSKVEGASDLQVFAKLVAEAYEKGTQAPAKLMQSAMEFIERQGQRLVAQDREIERLRTINARLSAEIMQLKALPPGPDEESGIVGALMQGVLQAQAEQAAVVAPAPNGKGK